MMMSPNVDETSHRGPGGGGVPVGRRDHGARPGRLMHAMYDAARWQIPHIHEIRGVCRVWLLDEVSAISGWTAVLKAARDGTAFGDDTVVATGSRWSTSDDVEGNLLAGRAGLADSRRVRHLLPMTFRAFADATRPGLVLPGPVHPAHLQDTSVAHTLDEVRFDLDAYDFAWQDYLTCGGFPRAVHEHTRSGTVSDGFMRDIAAWLRRDIDPDAPAESIPLLLDGLATRSSQ